MGRPSPVHCLSPAGLFDRLLAFRRRLLSSTPPQPDRRVRLSVEGLEDRVVPAPVAPVGRPGGAVPGYFEHNVGQVDRSVDFVARGGGYTLFLTPGAFTVAGRVPGLAGRGPQTDSVRVRLAGANPNAVAVGQGDMDLRTAYIRGANPANWVTNVPTSARVTYSGVYAGVDATYYADPARGLAFDFVVRPGGDASAVRLASDSGLLAVTPDGKLSVTTARGTVTLSAPVAYQDGAGGRSAVTARFVQRVGGVGFELGTHDRARAVVIDPAIGYGSLLGGSADDRVYAVAADAAGNAYLTGYSHSSDLPGQWTGAPGNAATDIMVAKLSPDGRRLLYVTYIGGAGSETGFGIAVDGAGAAYVVGETTSTNFPTTTGALDTSGSGYDGFALKLAADGQSVTYATYVSPAGASTTAAHAVAVDSSTGQAVVVGGSNANLAYTTATVIGTGTGGAFVLRLNAAGTAAVYNTTLTGGAAFGEPAEGVALDASGNVYVSGMTYSSDFMGTSGVFGTDGGAFVTKLTGGTTSSYVYGIASTNTAAASGTGIAVDASGNAYVSGYTEPARAPVGTTTGAYQTAAGGDFDGFALKLTSSGTVSYATYLGGSGSDEARGIAVDAAGNAYVGGWSASTNYPLLDQLQSSGGGTDAVLTKLSPTGAGVYSTYVGGSGTDEGYGVAVTPNGDAYLAGYTASTDFPASGGFSSSLHGGSDGFVVRVGPPVPATILGSAAAAALGNLPSATGPSGVRPDGALDAGAASDLGAGGFEGPVALARSFGNLSGGWADGLTGSGWFSSLGLSVRKVGTSYAVVAGATGAEYFDPSGGNFVPRYASLSKLTVGSTEITYTDAGGNTLVFYSYGSTVSSDRMGRFKRSVSAGGKETAVTAETGDGKASEVQRTDGTTTESWLYAFVASGVNKGLVESVTHRRKVGAGSWATVRKAAYAYYDGTTAHGTAGSLKTATILDGADAVVGRAYHRYYAAGEANGYAGALKYAFDGVAYARIAAAFGSVDSATDAQAAPYASVKLKYDSERRVTESVVGGAGDSGTVGGLGTHAVAYAASTHAAGVNNWATRTTETLPDGGTRKTYANSNGAPVLVAFTPAGSSTPYLDYFRYSSDGKLVLHALPSAVSGFSESNADLVGYSGGVATHLRDSEGLVETLAYASATTATTSAAGDVAGLLKSTAVRRGETGGDVPQTLRAYIVRTAGGADYYFAASDTAYRNDDGTCGQATSYAYTWTGSTAQVASVTTTLPTVTTAQNGPNTATSAVTVLDAYGNPVWSKDQAGFITYRQFDIVTGAVVKAIVDVDTAQTSTFAGLPAGWVTPAGGGRHLTTNYEVDSLGRVTKETTPAGRVNYTVYDDDAFEVRYYPGWDAATNKPTGPTTVMREDRAGGYTETLTMSATPAVSSNRPTGAESIAAVQSLSRSYMNAAGQATHTDVYFDLNGLTYSTAANLGTENANYYRTRYQYDDHGMVKRVETPLGTITRTVRDGLGRTASEWVGTDDTPTTGFWSPANTAGTDLVKVRESEYDSGGVGDGNLTKTTDIPGGGAASRVTQRWFNWRNWRVAVKAGVEASESTSVNRPLSYFDFDNLGNVVKTRVYDADGQTPTVTNGVPQPLIASLLRAQTTASFDELGRAYRRDVYSVDPTTGSVGSNTLKSDMWYDSRGNVIKTVSPGGLVQKSVIDGAGMTTAVYLTDGGGDAGYADADDVTGDVVVEQSEPTYDADGLPLSIVTRMRFHDATGTGALGTPTTGVFARVSYMGFYYDNAGRTTASVDVGTNGGAAWTRPSSVPARSDSVLVSSQNYAADAVQTVRLTGSPTGGTFTLTFGGQTTSGIAYNATASAVDAALEALSSVGSGNVVVTDAPGGGYSVRFAGTLAAKYQVRITGSGAGLTGGTSPAVAVSTISAGGDAGRVAETTDPRALVSRSYADALGRTLRGIENWVDGVVSDADDKTTDFAYNAAGMTSLTARLTGGGGQTTEWVYGVTTGTGSAVTSNDIVGKTRWPDPTTGAASISEQETVTVNALGQTLTMTDRNGNVHTLTLDVLGRVVSDAVTTLGSGVDGAVRRIETAYDAQGNAYLVTSYDAASGGGIVHQVQRAYSEMASGANHSRLTSMTYPSGYVLTHNYSAGLNGSISRLSSLSDSTGTLESFDHLGWAMVVKRGHSQPGVDLTYIAASAGEAGDQYAGLDRFGRVVDHFWKLSATGVARARHQYGYDRDGNRLWRDDLVNAAFGELYGYDNLNQITSFQRGTLNGTKTGLVGSASRSQSFDFDALGNWDAVTTDASTQTRTHNKQNEITAVSGATTPTFDASGNMTRAETGLRYVYDAWNRLVAVKDSPGTTTLKTYGYDGLNRRVTETAGGVTTDLYYSDAWQVLEEKVGANTARRYVWSPVYVDAMILRDRDTNGDSTLDERLWAVQDDNHNVVALIDGAGSVVERYGYDMFGVRTVYDASYNVRAGGSIYDFLHGFQGLRYDATAGLNFTHTRPYSPSLGRFTSPDWIRFRGGDQNLYRFVGNMPTKATDPTGQTLYIEGRDADVWRQRFGQFVTLTPAPNGLFRVDVLPAGRQGNAFHAAAANYLQSLNMVGEGDVVAQALISLFNGGVAQPDPNYDPASDRVLLQPPGDMGRRNERYRLLPPWAFGIGPLPPPLPPKEEEPWLAPLIGWDRIGVNILFGVPAGVNLDISYGKGGLSVKVGVGVGYSPFALPFTFYAHDGEHYPGLGFYEHVSVTPAIGAGYHFTWTAIPFGNAPPPAGWQPFPAGPGAYSFEVHPHVGVAGVAAFGIQLR